MVFILLNCILLACFIYLTYYVDKKGSFMGNSANTLLVPLLFACIEIFIYILVIIFKDKWIDSFVIQVVRILYCIDGIFFVSFSYGLIGVSTRIHKFFPRLIQWLLYAFVIYVVFFQFKNISVNADLSISVTSDRLFSADVQNFFPWDWVFVYNAIYQYYIN